MSLTPTRVTLLGLLRQRFPLEIRALIWAYSDPRTDHMMWPEWRILGRYADWGWFSYNEESCAVCGLKAEWHESEWDTVGQRSYPFQVATYRDTEGRWHFSSVCSYRCQQWYDYESSFTKSPLSSDLLLLLND